VNPATRVVPTTVVPTIPWWGLGSAALAPVLLIGGWQLAAALQPAGFDPVVATISGLTARDGAYRWVMTAALAGLGVCHAVTAAALRPAATLGRWVLALGGLATIVVAAAPLPAGGGASTTHTVAATVAFGALTGWLVVALPRTPASAVGTVVLVALLVWFGVELGGPRAGLAERILAGTQAIVPLAVVLGRRRRTS